MPIVTRSQSTVGVLGGGMLGLAMAWRLQERGHRVTVVEAADAIGGLTRHFESGDSTWDRFYHVVGASDQSLLRLLDDIGLAQGIC